MPAIINLADEDPNFQVMIPANTLITNSSQVDILINEISSRLIVVDQTNQNINENFENSILIGGAPPGGHQNNIKYLVYGDLGSLSLSPLLNFTVISPEININLVTTVNNAISDNKNYDTVNVKLTSLIGTTTQNVSNKKIIFSVTDANTSIKTIGTKTLNAKTDNDGEKSVSIFNGSMQTVDVNVTCSIDEENGASKTIPVHFIAPVNTNNNYTLTSSVIKNNSVSNNTDVDTITYTLLNNGMPTGKNESLTVTFNHVGSSFIENTILIPSPLTRMTNNSGQLTVNIVNAGGNAAQFAVTCNLTNGAAGNPNSVTDTINFIATATTTDKYRIDYVTTNNSSATSNGSDQIGVTATLFKNDQKAPSTPVTFYTTPDADGIFVQTGTNKYPTTTDRDGNSTFQLTSNVKKNKDYTIDGELTGTETVINTTVVSFSAPVVQVDKYEITLSADKTSGVKANSQEQSVVTATVRKNGELTSNVDITIQVDGNGFFPYNNSQTAQLTTQFTTPRKPGEFGSADIRVQNSGNVTQNVTVTCHLTNDTSVSAAPIRIGFVAQVAPPVDNYTITLSADPSAGTRANGSEVSIITATVRRNGQLASNVLLNISVNGNGFFPFNNSQTAPITTQPSNPPQFGVTGSADIRLANNAGTNQTVTVRCSLANNPNITAAPIQVSFIGNTTAPTNLVYTLFLEATTTSARIQPGAYPSLTGGSNHVTATLLDQFRNPPRAGTFITCSIQQQPQAYFRIISYNDIDVGNPYIVSQALPTNSLGQVNFRVAQWRSPPQPAFFDSFAFASFNGRNLRVLINWFNP